MRNTLVAWGIGIFLISFFVRGIFLQSVNQVVFDEVHFGKFISSYCCTHKRFFDIHPPIGKLMIAGGAYLSGYKGEFPFNSIGQPYGDVSVQGIRMTVAFVGALLPVVIFILLLQVGVSLPFALLGACAALFENALIVESRLILTDSILLTATFAAILFAFASLRSQKENYSWLWVILAGIMSGIAVGTKFTGLIAGALVGVVFVWGMVRPSPSTMKGKYSSLLLKLLVCGFVAILVYLIGWMMHFSLLTVPGEGDAWGVPTGNYWEDLRVIHKQMVSANYYLSAAHPYGSAWWTWPFMVRSVFYWQGEGNQFIYLIGNPLVWWGSIILLAAGSVLLVVRLILEKWKRFAPVLSSGAWIFIVGYFVAYIPLMRVPRVLFLYHYLTPLLFSLLFGIWWLDGVVPKNKKTVAIVTGICIFAGFCFIGPLTFGVPISDVWYQALFSFSSWR